MARISALRCGALTFVIALLFGGVADAQLTTPVAPGTRRTGYCTGGLLTLVAGQMKFHVSLDDRERQPSAFVVMRIIDHEGVVVAARSLWLRAGHSATLEFTGVGQFRAQAETFESLLTTVVSDRRRAVGTVELFDDFRIVLPVQCAEPAGQGRIPG